MVLAEHLGRWEGGAAAPAWELLSSLMTDVLKRDEWLKVRFAPQTSSGVDVALDRIAFWAAPADLR